MKVRIVRPRRYPRCVLCHRKAFTSIEIECGNNAENMVTLELCYTHLREAEKEPCDFSDTYGEKIEEEWLENQLVRADMLKED